MENNKRKLLLMLFTFFICFGMMGNVKAKNYMNETASGYIKRSAVSNQIKDVRWDGSMTYKGWSTTSPANASTRDAWCTTFHHPSDEGFVSGAYSTSRCGDWFDGKDNALRYAGQIADYLSVRYKNDSDKDRKYIYTVLTLNSYFAKKGVDGAVDFTKERNKHSANAALRSLITEFIQLAKTEMAKVDANKMNKPSVDVGNNTMHKVGDYYVSDQISIKVGSVETTSFSNTHTSVTTPTHSLVESTSNPTGNVWYCSDSLGKSCTQTAPTGNFSGYIKITGATAGTFEFTFTSSATMTYKTGVIVCHGYKTNQAMMILNDKSKSLSDHTTFKLYIPRDVEVRISKVDENGDSVEGAEFSLKDQNNTNIELETTDGGKTFVSKNLAQGYTLLDKTLTLVETKAPDGYKKLESQEYHIPNKNGPYCYDGNNTESDPSEGACNVTKVCKIIITTAGEVCSAENEEDCGESSENWGSDGTNSTSEDFTETTDGECDSNNKEPEYNVDPSNPKKRTKVTVTSLGSVCKKGGVEVECNRYVDVTVNGNSVFLVIPNTKNTVTISKKAATGEGEVEGASLKICKLSDYNGNGGVNEKCTAAKTVGGVSLEWVSTNVPKLFEGVPQGTYVIIETLPPTGYLPLSTVTQFTIDENNKVSSGATTSNSNTIIVHNMLNEVVISKTDIVTTKELPGAKLAICLAGLKKDMVSITDEDDSEDSNSDGDSSSESDGVSEDDTASTNPSDYAPVIGYDGDCIPATLKDGSGEAVWVSGNSPHKINGLGEGTYFLVETTAPNGYATSESILFRMNANGELTDIKGNSLKDNKIVMKDAPIKQVKTGKTGLVIAVVGALAAAAASVYFFAFHNKAVAVVSSSDVASKIRKRKIHK